jgi:hypothetical protein
MEKNKGGRPVGAKTRPAEVVPVFKSRCPKCGSTERGEYIDRNEQAYGGVAPDGNDYTHIIRRRCVCAACNQLRIDKTYENRGKS